jgi:hypothetical protein
VEVLFQGDESEGRLAHMVARSKYPGTGSGIRSGGKMLSPVFEKSDMGC